MLVLLINNSMKSLKLKQWICSDDDSVDAVKVDIIGNDLFFITRYANGIYNTLLNAPLSRKSINPLEYVFLIYNREPFTDLQHFKEYRKKLFVVTSKEYDRALLQKYSIKFDLFLYNFFIPRDGDYRIRNEIRNILIELNNLNI